MPCQCVVVPVGEVVVRCGGQSSHTTTRPSGPSSGENKRNGATPRPRSTATGYEVDIDRDRGSAGLDRSRRWATIRAWAWRRGASVCKLGWRAIGMPDWRKLDGTYGPLSGKCDVRISKPATSRACPASAAFLSFSCHASTTRRLSPSQDGEICYVQPGLGLYLTWCEIGHGNPPPLTALARGSPKDPKSSTTHSLMICEWANSGDCVCRLFRPSDAQWQ